MESYYKRYIERYAHRYDLQYPIKFTKYPVRFLIKLMKELFPYREVIGYKSWLYIMYSEPFTGSTSGCECTDSDIFIKWLSFGSYYDRRKDETGKIYRDGGFPQNVLLIDENRECREINLSEEFILELAKYGPNFVNLGRMIFAIDATYDPVHRQICNNYLDIKNNNSDITKYLKEDLPCKIPIDLIPFISVKYPDPCCYGYITAPPNNVINFICNNLDDIKKDLKSMSPTGTSIKYITKREARMNNIAKRKGELLEELDKLNKLLDEEPYTDE